MAYPEGTAKAERDPNGGDAVNRGIGKPSNPKDRAATARLDLSLFPDTATAYGALAMTEGDLKYGGYNYRPAGVASSVYIAACRRHLAKWYNGEENDPVTGVPHLGSALACLAVLIDSLESGNLNDDRPPKVDVSGLLSKLEGKVKHLQKIFPNGPGRFREKNQSSEKEKYTARFGIAGIGAAMGGSSGEGSRLPKEQVSGANRARPTHLDYHGNVGRQNEADVSPRADPFGGGHDADFFP